MLDLDLECRVYFFLVRLEDLAFIEVELKGERSGRVSFGLYRAEFLVLVRSKGWF